ncbi:lactoylglutathione lyase [Paraglaciecola sp.]|uniref:lactoylglutathione lyase n=1 Tax=Paraglaciecola sp. TaxID=1920173 RepID=UPI003EF38E58
MKVQDIRPFLPSKHFEESKAFYQSLGFTMDTTSQELVIMQNGSCTFFLHNGNGETDNKGLMFQLCVEDIKECFTQISTMHPLPKFEPIKHEPWGKVLYLWGPDGELWHITQLAHR